MYLVNVYKNNIVHENFRLQNKNIDRWNESVK